MSQNLLSAAVVIGALRVKWSLCIRRKFRAKPNICCKPLKQMYLYLYSFHVFFLSNSLIYIHPLCHFYHLNTWSYMPQHEKSCLWHFWPSKARIIKKKKLWKKALKMTSQLVIFRAFLFIFLVPPSLWDKIISFSWRIFKKIWKKIIICQVKLTNRTTFVNKKSWFRPWPGW